MNPAELLRLMALLTVVATASLGCAHAREPERKMYLISEDASHVDFQDDARGTGGAGADAYCNEIQKQCYTKCMRRKPGISSIEKHSGKHKEHCTTQCLEEFMACVKKMEEAERRDAQGKQLRFSGMSEALGWLEAHTREAPPGTHVIVAGVGFVIAVLGGALFLVPI